MAVSGVFGGLGERGRRDVDADGLDEVDIMPRTDSVGGELDSDQANTT